MIRRAPVGGGRMWLVVCLALGLVLACAKKKEAPGPLDALPPDVPVFTTAKVVESRKSDLGMQIILHTMADAEEVMDWYQRRLPPLGWTVAGQVGENPRMLLARKQERSLTVSLREGAAEEPKVLTLNYMARF